MYKNSSLFILYNWHNLAQKPSFWQIAEITKPWEITVSSGWKGRELTWPNLTPQLRSKADPICSEKPLTSSSSPNALWVIEKFVGAHRGNGRGAPRLGSFPEPPHHLWALASPCMCCVSVCSWGNLWSVLSAWAICGDSSQGAGPSLLWKFYPGVPVLWGNWQLLYRKIFFMEDLASSELKRTVDMIPLPFLWGRKLKADT